METRALGRSGLQVPVVGMGTWRTLDLHGAEAPRGRALVDAALAAGARLIDTSPMYGESERVLADALTGRRDQALVATKVWTRSAAEGRRQIERALAWFGGSVDVYQVHNLVAWRDHLPFLESLRDEGRIRVVGATQYEHSQFAGLLELMKTGRIAQVQIPYNALDREVEHAVLPAAAQLGLGVLVMQPLGVGSLVKRSPAPAALARLERFGVRTWAQALLKWILSDPRVHCVIPATSHPERVAENAAAGEPPWFDEDTREYVARLAQDVA
jgi:aryl-alcohol dehydrogenase-like predicted oxidoreductase